MSGDRAEGEVLRQEEIREVVRKDVGEGVGVVGYWMRAASEKPLGFLGEHFFVDVEVELGEGGSRKTLNYFAKRMPTEVAEHREYAKKTRAFYKEVELYKTAFEDFGRAQSGVVGLTKWRPEYFYSRGSELFVVENLTSEGYYMYPDRRYLDERHVKASLRAMAGMHAASVVFEEKFNGGLVETLSPGFVRAAGRKVTVGDTYSHLTFETEASDVKGHPGNTYMEAGIASQVKIVEFLPGYSQAQKQTIQEKLPSVLRQSLQLVKTSNRFRNVFVHGDLWANNLLFRRSETGEVEAVLIDFQLARYAPPAHDVMMFLHLVQSKEFREDNQRSLLEYYYAAFAQELDKNSLSADTLLSWQAFSDSCHFYDDLGLIIKLFYFQFILAPSEIFTKFFCSHELFKKIMLVDRTEMVLECFLNDQLYRHRVTQALNEVIAKFIIPPPPPPAVSTNPPQPPNARPQQSHNQSPPKVKSIHSSHSPQN